MLTAKRLEVLMRISKGKSTYESRYWRHRNWLFQHGYAAHNGLTMKGLGAIAGARAMRDLLKQGGVS